jgi:hypothetical protein
MSRLTFPLSAAFFVKINPDELFNPGDLGFVCSEISTSTFVLRPKKMGLEETFEILYERTQWNPCNN